MQLGGWGQLDGRLRGRLRGGRGRHFESLAWEEELMLLLLCCCLWFAAFRCFGAVMCEIKYSSLAKSETAC